MIHSLYKSVLILGTAFTLTACGGSGSEDSTETPDQTPGSGSDLKTFDSLVRTFSIQNETCPNGGIEVEMGIDSNGNNRLDPNEVDHSRTQTVCHGANGSDGANGTASLIVVTAPTLEECPQGGKKILIGADTDANQILENSEITQTELLCNAVINASESISSLINTSVETAGGNCSAGGVRIDSGMDINNDQVLNADEIQSTSYVCSGQDGTNGVDGTDGTGGAANLDNLLIETIDEPFGENCLHGGDKHRIGEDKNQDGILQEDEVISASYSCNANGAPSIYFSGRESTVAGFEYLLRLHSIDGNNSIYGLDEVEVTVLEKPSWLSIVSNEQGNVELSGLAQGDIGDVHTIKVSSTDGDLTTQESFEFTIADGIQVSVSADDVIEGNLSEPGQTEITQGEFIIRLSKAASAPLLLNYQISPQFFHIEGRLPSNVSSGSVEFSIGETEKNISIDILRDVQYEVLETLEFRIVNTDYSATELILLPSHNEVLNIINDDYDVLLLPAGQPLSLPHLGFSNDGSYVPSISLKNQPDWMTYNTQDYGHQCTYDTSYYCFQLYGSQLNGEPTTDLIGEQGEFDLVINLAGQNITRTMKYLITEGDKDSDGALDSADIFPENPRGQTDTDADGLGDEWEMANFDSLNLSDGTSDFDSNGITDKSAFENDTPINDISFSFESGELPAGWVNTGNVNWVVSNTLSYDGEYALTLERSLAPNETARIEFEVNNQAGDLRLYAKALEQANHASLDLFFERYSSHDIHAGIDYWNSFSRHFDVGRHKLVLQYRNHSSTHNAPVVYIDNISGLAGMIPADRDGDGVLNSVDLYPDRSDAATDSDGDGIADEWEQRYFGTLDRTTATSDFDNDGLLDINEFIQATSPSNSDSDGDGILDAADAFPVDIQYQADTDNDGLADKWELAHLGSLETSDGTQDSDGDSVNDLAEFIAGTAATPDRDGDGAADVVDAFPDNASYKLDTDKDGIADKWEYLYDHVNYFSADGDYDNDGRTDLKEFLEGTNPIQANLNAVEDILSVVQGQTITFNPGENDIASQENQGSITTVSVSLPSGEQANFGSLQDNADGTFSYTAANDCLGWLRLSYVANDGESDANGEIFIHIVDSAPAQVIKIDGADYSSYHSMALFDDGSLYAWGANGQGQLGLGTTINNYVPTRVGGLPEIIDFSLGYQFSLALAADGTVWKWGGGVSTATQLAATGIKGITADDCCSSSEYYLLQQDGTVLRSSSLVAGLSNIKEIKAGHDYLLALDESGIVWALGSNSQGQLGYGQDTSSVSSPVRVSKITNIKSIEAGNYQSFAIDEDGQLFAWGYNRHHGALGDGTTINRNVPVLISSLTNVAEVAAGNNHTLVRTDTGDVYGMGYGNSGALGNAGNSSSVMTPIKLTEEKVTSIGAGNQSSFFITEDGLSYSFGTNTNGQLGDGTTQNHSEPAEISWLLDGVVSELGKEGFEWGRIPPYWRNSGNNWEVVSNATASDVKTGSYAVKVKDRLTDSASASLGLQIATGAGDVSFNVKTSSEADYDKLVFYVDGIEQASFSGNNDWVSSASISVIAGVHSFEWIYHKDGGTSAGEDTVWIDDILLPIDSDGDGVIDRQDATPYIPNPTP